MGREKLRFFADQATVKRFQKIGLWGGLVGAYLVIQPEHQLSPEAGLPVVHGIDAFVEPAGNGPMAPDFPGLIPELFASTRVGRWALLRASLPANTELFVDHTTAAGLIAYVGGDDHTRLLAKKIGSMGRLRGTRFMVVPFEDRPSQAAFPLLTDAELWAALTRQPRTAWLEAQVRELLSQVTGVEYGVPSHSDVRVHVVPTASDAEVSRVQRVFPEISTPGRRVNVMRDGLDRWLV